jgi:hypothetical protein
MQLLQDPCKIIANTTTANAKSLQKTATTISHANATSLSLQESLTAPACISFRALAKEAANSSASHPKGHAYQKCKTF